MCVKLFRDTSVKIFTKTIRDGFVYTNKIIL